MHLLGYFIFSLVFVYPAWRIFDKAGLNPALSLFIFIPGIGVFVSVCILAFSVWPNTIEKELI